MMTEEELNSLAVCSQCGMQPSEVEEEYLPEMMVIEYNFGEPYLFGVRCQICCRVATAVGREAAIERWNAGGHDLDIDEYGEDMED